MFVIKFTDKASGSWAFQVKDVYQNLGQVDLFDKDSCYKTREEAEQHILNALANPDCGRWRDDVDTTYFEVVEVYPLPMMPTAYTTVNYERKENIIMNYDVKKDGAVVAIRIFVADNGLTPMAEIKFAFCPDTVIVQWDVVANREMLSPGITAYTLWYDERPKRDFREW